ncbi:sugar ABC transporter ATP-binding protein [Ochrobactrum grignonense]|nr:sugar ABC transporter ATP-binding protein [Brucella grignonensis]
MTVLRDGHVVVAGLIDEFDPAKLIEAMSGRSIDSQRLARATASPSGVMFKVRDLGRRGQFASIDLDLRAGEIISVVGLLGSGRTELALALFGCLAPDEGRIEDESGPLHLAAPADAMAHGIAYVPEDRLTEGLFLNQPIRENIVVSSLEVDTKGGVVKATSLTERARDAVKRLRIKTPCLSIRRNALGGNQQRVVLARWMERKQNCSS